MILLHNPKKKATNYVAKITDDIGKTIRIKIPTCNIVYLREQPTGGHLLRLIISKDLDQYKEIQQIDDTICENAILNNQKWFNNNLQESEIKEFFRPSLNIVQDTMTVMISDIKDTIITLNGTVLDSIDEVDYNNSSIDLSLEIEAQGLYFFPKKFGIRWSVNKLTFTNVDLLYKNDNDDSIDRLFIENEWDNEISFIKESIIKDIEILNNKIHILKEYSKDLENSYQQTIAISSIKDWNLKFIELSHKITKYYSGFITAKDQ